MKTFKQLLEQTKNHSALNLDSHTSGMKKYSHGVHHIGFVDNDMKADVSHKKLHAAAKSAGYTYYKKDDTNVGGNDMTYHMYSKAGGPYRDHHLTITTPKGSDKVWNIEHKTVKDNS